MNVARDLAQAEEHVLTSAEALSIFARVLMTLIDQLPHEPHEGTHAAE